MGTNRIIPSLQFYKTSCSVRTVHWTARRDYQVSHRAEGLIRWFCADRSQRININCAHDDTELDRLTKIIFVSSNSCWTFIMVSACLGSWYLSMYVVISGKDIEDGFENED